MTLDTHNYYRFCFARHIFNYIRTGIAEIWTFEYYDFLTYQKCGLRLLELKRNKGYKSPSVTNLVMFISVFLCLFDHAAGSLYPVVCNKGFKLIVLTCLYTKGADNK